MTRDELRAALAMFRGRRTGCLRIGPRRDSAGRLRVSVPDGGVATVPLDGVEAEWLVPGSALLVSDAGRTRSAGRTLLWDLDDRGAVRAVTVRLAQEVGLRAAERALERLERDS